MNRLGYPLKSPEIIVVSTHIRLESRMNHLRIQPATEGPPVICFNPHPARKPDEPGMDGGNRERVWVVSTHIRLESRMNLHQRKRASGRSLRPEIAIVLAGCFKPASFGLPEKKSSLVHLSFMREPPVILRLLWIRGILYHKTAFLSRPFQLTSGIKAG